jgi:hypothetical protein
MKDKLIKYSHNIYSQFGEDGIIGKIFEIIGTHSKFVLNSVLGMVCIFQIQPVFGKMVGKQY